MEALQTLKQQAEHIFKHVEHEFKEINDWLDALEL